MTTSAGDLIVWTVSGWCVYESTGFHLGNIGLINPLIIRSFIDSIQTGTTLGRLIALAALFTGIALVHQLVSVAEAYLGGLVSWTATNSLRNDLASHALSLDVSYHNTHTPGEMIERVDGDSETLGGFLSTFALQMVGNGLLFIGILGLLFREDWRAGLVLTVFAAVSAAILVRLRNFSAANWKASREASAEVFGFLEERLSGTEDIRSSGAQAYATRASRPASW